MLNLILMGEVVGFIVANLLYEHYSLGFVGPNVISTPL